MSETTQADPVQATIASSRSVWMFLAALLLTAMLVSLIGWYTHLRHVMHGALISVAVFALLPFAIIAFGIFLGMMVTVLMLIAALLGDGGDASSGADVAQPFVRGGASLIGPYYRWLAQRRHPLFWGIPAGILLGGLALWLFISVYIIPPEARTTETLAELQQEIERIYKEDRRYPRPDANGHLTHAALGRTTPGPILDGFGRPVEYQVEGRWRLASYRLRSYGFDGQPGRDDLCIAGATRLARITSLFRYKTEGGGKLTAAKAKLNAIKEMRCAQDE